MRCLLNNYKTVFFCFSFIPTAVPYIYVPYPTMIFEHLLKLIILVRRKKKKISELNLNHINHIRKEEIANSELCRCANKAKKVNPKGFSPGAS
jgi:hypothetical protein